MKNTSHQLIRASFLEISVKISSKVWIFVCSEVSKSCVLSPSLGYVIKIFIVQFNISKSFISSSFLSDSFNGYIDLKALWKDVIDASKI